VTETTQLTTRDAPFIKTCKKKLTNHYDRNNTPLLLNFNKHSTQSLASHMPKLPNIISIIPPLPSRAPYHTTPSPTNRHPKPQTLNENPF
jgi:hypothetical protein